MSTSNFDPIGFQKWPPGSISEVMMIARVTKFSLCISNAVTSHVLLMSVFTDFSRPQTGQSQKVELGPSSR